MIVMYPVERQFNLIHIDTSHLCNIQSKGFQIFYLVFYLVAHLFSQLIDTLFVLSEACILLEFGFNFLVLFIVLEFVKLSLIN